MPTASKDWSTAGASQIRITASDGASGDFFGYSVSVSGDIVVAGSSHDDDNGVDSGSLYVYEKNTGTGVWEEFAKLKPSDGASQDYFGTSVSVSGNIIVAGGYADDDNGLGSGSVYAFEKNISSDAWEQVAKLHPSDPATNDAFGYRVTVDEGVIIASSIHHYSDGTRSGAVWVFEKNDSNTWVEVAKLSDGSDYDYFGHSVSLSSNVAVIGAPYDDYIANDNGAAYVFERSDNGVWALAAKLKAIDAQGNVDVILDLRPPAYWPTNSSAT